MGTVDCIVAPAKDFVNWVRCLVKIQVMSDTDASAITTTAFEHRTRLLQGMANMTAQKGLADTTIADIVREAGMSKRSFYEHFDSKNACFLALYEAASATALRSLQAAVKPGVPWQNQLEAAFNGYFGHLASGSLLLRALLVDIHLLDAEGAAVRRSVMLGLARFLCETVNPDDDPGPQPHISSTLAMATVGGINELVLQMIERGEATELQRLTPTACELVRSLTRAHG